MCRNGSCRKTKAVFLFLLLMCVFGSQGVGAHLHSEPCLLSEKESVCDSARSSSVGWGHYKAPPCISRQEASISFNWIDLKRGDEWGSSPPLHCWALSFLDFVWKLVSLHSYPWSRRNKNNFWSVGCCETETGYCLVLTLLPYCISFAPLDWEKSSLKTEAYCFQKGQILFKTLYSEAWICKWALIRSFEWSWFQRIFPWPFINLFFWQYGYVSQSNKC